MAELSTSKYYTKRNFTIDTNHLYVRLQATVDSEGREARYVAPIEILICEPEEMKRQHYNGWEMGPSVQRSTSTLSDTTRTVSIGILVRKYILETNMFIRKTELKCILRSN
jgi:hypothetical protein